MTEPAREIEVEGDERESITEPAREIEVEGAWVRANDYRWGGVAIQGVTTHLRTAALHGFLWAL